MMIRALGTLQRGSTTVGPRLAVSRLETSPRLRILSALQYQTPNWFSTESSTATAAAAQIDHSTTTPISIVVPKFAVVKHGEAYKAAMRGLHGQQLALALLEGEGKDEPDFDPFLEEELEEARLIAEAEEAKNGGKPRKELDEDADRGDGDDADSEDDDDDEEDDILEEKDTSSPLFQHKQNRKKYKNDGSLKRNKSESAILRAGSPAGGLVAVIALAGTQHKVTTDDVLIVNRLKPVSDFCVGSIQTLRDDQVLLVTSSALTLVGMPFVPGAEVDVLVEEITRDAKVIIFKKRRRKNSKRKTGFRRDVTMLRVIDIRFPEPFDAHEHVERPEPAPLVPK